MSRTSAATRAKDVEIRGWVYNKRRAARFRFLLSGATLSATWFPHICNRKEPQPEESSQPAPLAFDGIPRLDRIFRKTIDHRVLNVSPLRRNLPSGEAESSPSPTATGDDPNAFSLPCTCLISPGRLWQPFHHQTLHIERILRARHDLPGGIVHPKDSVFRCLTYHVGFAKRLSHLCLAPGDQVCAGRQRLKSLPPLFLANMRTRQGS